VPDSAVDPDPNPEPQRDVVYGIGHEEEEPLPLPLNPGPAGTVMSVLGTAGGYITGRAPQLSEPPTSTPLAIGETEGSIPTGPLWAMKYLRHGQYGALTGHDAPEELRLAIGSDGDTTYVIDDGASHAMVARRVGSAPDGSLYCLVARVRIEDVQDVRNGWAPADGLFAGGRELTLCAVVEGSVSNVVRVAGYRHYRDVPPEYLPPSPFIEFTETL
jgi:hypothetical protein